MQHGIVQYATSEQISTFMPSDSVWARSQGNASPQEGTGYELLYDFKDGVLPPRIAILSTTAATVTYDNPPIYDSVLKLLTGTASGTLNAIQFATRPFGQPIVNGNNALQFEAIVAVNQLSTQGVFIGLASQSAISTATGVIAAVTNVQSTNTMVAGNLIGFYQHGDNPSTFDIWYQNGTTSTTLLANALNANVFSQSSTQFQFLGTQTGTGVTPNSAAPYPLTGSTDFVKYGITYVPYSNTGNNGTWYFFVNGTQVASLQSNNTTNSVNSSTSYGAVVNLSSPVSTSQISLDLAYLRIAYGERNG
jgi:hypothetical protein